MKVIDEDNNFIVDLPDHLTIISNSILNLFNWLYRVVYVSSDTIYVRTLHLIDINTKGCKLWT